MPEPALRPAKRDRGDLLAQPADLALRDAGHAHGLDQIIDRAGGDALNVGFLDHRGECLLGHAPRFEEVWKVAASSKLRNPEFDLAGPSLPVSIAIAVPLRQPLGALLPIGRASASELANLQLHQPPGGKANHVA